MKVTIIKASAEGPYKTYKQQRGGPPQGIFSLAAATPQDVAVTLVDETAGMTAPGEPDDLVAILMSTPDAHRAYDLARDYRGRGRTVVFAGLHPTFMPNEALEHGDAVIIGEAEGVWGDLLADHRAGNLRRLYRRHAAVDMATLAPYPAGLVDPARYGGAGSVLVSRGCPRHCSFCLVHPFFRTCRFRPVGAVVEEVRRCGARWLELHADNLTVDRDYALELFRALKPLGVKWVGETTIRLAEDEELLQAAVESGCQYLLVGLETPSRAALGGAAKSFVRPAEAKELVARLHEHEIVVDASMLFGFDSDGPTIFEEAYDFVREVGVDVSDGIIVIPFPGSRLFADLDRQGRILTRDWSRYDGNNVVFRPLGMTPQQLAEGQRWFWNKRYSLGPFLGRKLAQVRHVGLGKTMMLGWM